jgi:hypothetical protein
MQTKIYVEICYFRFFWPQNFIFHVIFAGEMFDNIYYFLSHFNQIFILNFGLGQEILYFRYTFQYTFQPAKILKLLVCKYYK